MFYLKDPTTKEPSPTLTMMFMGVGAALVKLFLAGSVIAGLQFGEFSGLDCAAVVAPFLALYGHKRVVAGSTASAKKSEKARQ